MRKFEIGDRVTHPEWGAGTVVPDSLAEGYKAYPIQVEFDSQEVVKANCRFTADGRTYSYVEATLTHLKEPTATFIATITTWNDDEDETATELVRISARNMREAEQKIYARAEHLGFSRGEFTYDLQALDEMVSL